MKGKVYNICYEFSPGHPANASDDSSSRYFLITVQFISSKLGKLQKWRAAHTQKKKKVLRNEMKPCQINVFRCVFIIPRVQQPVNALPR